MKRLLLLTVLLGSVVLVGTTSSPAYAKGATDVWVSGPGMEKTVLGYTRRMDDVDVGYLAEVSGIYLIYGAAIATDDPGLSQEELGPRYVLTWYAGGTVMAVSHVYPFSVQGAWTHIPYEDGGWVRGGPDLEHAMVELGARVSTSSTAVEQGSPSSTAGESDSGATAGEPRSLTTAVESGSPTAAGPAWLSGLAALVVVAGVTAWLLRRRTGTLAAWPLHRST